MDIKLKISTQIYENKAHYEGGESWRPKGDFTFFTYIDSFDAMMVDKEWLISVLEELVICQNTDIEKFEYRSHELIFSEEEIPAAELDEIINRRLNRNVTNLKTKI